jgi:predicted O-linked N-acetylglucosamine transferase (SPINDLY family)
MLFRTNRMSARSGPLSGTIASSDLGQMSFDALIAIAEAAGPNADRTGIVELYRRWITGQGPGMPHLYAAWFNLGTELTRSGEKANAMLAYRNALSLQPTFAPAAINLALLLRSDNLGNETFAVLRGALQPDEARTELINNRARLLEKCGRLLEAEREFPKC